MDSEDFKELLGEGLHTAFRKASDSYEANKIWHLIMDMPGEEWDRIVQFVAEPLWQAVTA